jgi:plastocyanin
LHNNRLSTVVLISAVVISTGFITIANVSAQLGSMYSTYAVSIIPGAAQRESAFHYYPPAIAVPVGTNVAWFNNDAGQ